MNLISLLQQLDERGIRLQVEGDQLRVMAPKGAMTAELRDLITENKAELLAKLQAPQPGTTQSLPQVVSRLNARYEPFPLTDIQHAYWIGRSDALGLGGVATHAYMEFEYTYLDVERLTDALNKVIARHEMLHAIVLPSGQQQIFPDVLPYHIPMLDLSTMSKNEQDKAVVAVRQELSNQVLPLDQFPMLDIRVTCLNDACFLLHISVDILMFDVGSLYIFFNEWQTFYESPKVTLPSISLSFRDYVLAEEELKLTAFYKKAQDYWLKRIDNLSPGPELPLSQDPSTLTEPTFHRRTHRLEKESWQMLKTQAQRLGISPSILLFNAFALVLKTWCKRPHFTLNLTLFNRLPLHPEVDQLIGDFTSLILIDIDYTAPISLREQSQKLQRQLWEALEYRYFSGVKVMREIARKHGSPIAGLMPVVFTSAVGIDQKGSHAFARPFNGRPTFSISQTPQVWLDHQIFEQDDELLFNWDTVDALFPSNLLDEMFETYCALLERLATDDVIWHEPHLSLIPDHQMAQRTAVNATEALISTELLHTLFLQKVVDRATEPAVITSTMTLTYQELYDRANQVGHWLRTQGAKPNQLVAVVMEKGWEQVVAVLGIHLSGAAYLPIDPNLPTERRTFLLEEGEVALALTQNRLDDALSWPEEMAHLSVDTLDADVTLPPLDIVQQPTDLAYVIYTSGSTGRPKGVVIDHRGAVNTVLDVNQRYGVTASDRVLALSALNFDLSVYDIFGLLAAGGAIVMPDPDQRIDPEHWSELIHQHGVTVWNTVPALMQMLVEYEEGRDDKMTRWQDDKMNGNYPFIPSSLHLVMLSGDWIPVTLPDRIKALWEGVKVYSMGGATEASIWSIDYPIVEVDPTWTSIPYGKPMTNQTFHVLDGKLNPRPTWVPGDLYIGGIGVALGYWKDEERTNASFITHAQTGERLYKTGDLGRYLSDGNIEFLGRDDFQVKIRGHRIELGEIESTLLQHPGVQESVVNAVGDPKGHRQLVGYVVLDEAWQESQDTAEQMPDVYDEMLAVALTDPIDRLEFKLRQSGVRSVPNVTPVALPSQTFDEAQRQRWLARQSYRQFLDEAIALDSLSDFLSCLMQMPLENIPLPKYRYPSAGNLYPVQCYLHIKPDRIAGLAGGYYYYQPEQHILLPLSVGETEEVSGEEVSGDKVSPFGALGANQAIFDDAAFALFLVANLDAITPMYGDIARDFSMLEAGYISQLLMMEAPQHDLGLCPIGGLDVVPLHSALMLGENHQLLHTLAGGPIDPNQQIQWLQGMPKHAIQEGADTQTWQHQLQHYLAQKLPDYMVPTIYIPLDTLPLTTNGKVDRKALPVPDATLFQTVKFVPPRNEIEQIIADIWSDLLDINSIGVHDDFFAIGGDSLIAIVQII